jgi:hypothetical protein
MVAGLLFILFVVVCVGGVLFFLARTIGRAPSESVDADHGTVTGTIEGRPGEGSLELHDCMLSGRGRVKVVGEQYYDQQIRSIVRGLGHRPGVVGDWDAGLHTVAFLIREPRNKHDRNAVVVKMMAGTRLVTVGYIAAVDAPAWRPLLKPLEDVGMVGICHAYIYVGGDSRHYQVVLRLAPPDEALLGNAFPTGAVPLEPAREAALVGEGGHQDVLAGVVGTTRWATLHEGVMEAGAHKGELAIEAHVDGDMVGTLSAAQSTRYRPLLDFGEIVACELDVFQGKRIAEARVWLPKVD